MQPYEEVGGLGESSDPTVNEVEESKCELGFLNAAMLLGYQSKLDEFTVHVATREHFFVDRDLLMTALWF